MSIAVDGELLAWVRSQAAPALAGVVTQDGATANLLRAAAEVNDRAVDSAIAAAPRADEGTLRIVIERYRQSTDASDQEIVDNALTHRNLSAQTRSGLLRGALSHQTHSWESVVLAGSVPRNMRDEFVYHPDKRVTTALLRAPGVASRSECWTFSRHPDPDVRRLASRALLNEHNNASHCQLLWETGDATIRSAVIANLADLTTSDGITPPRKLTRVEERQAKWLVANADIEAFDHEPGALPLCVRLAWLHPNDGLAAAVVERLMAEGDDWPLTLWGRTESGVGYDTRLRKQIISAMGMLDDGDLARLSDIDEPRTGGLAEAATAEAARRTADVASDMYTRLLDDALALEAGQRNSSITRRGLLGPAVRSASRHLAAKRAVRGSVSQNPPAATAEIAGAAAPQSNGAATETTPPPTPEAPTDIAPRAGHAGWAAAEQDGATAETLVGATAEPPSTSLDA